MQTCEMQNLKRLVDDIKKYKTIDEYFVLEYIMGEWNVPWLENEDNIYYVYHISNNDTLDKKVDAYMDRLIKYIQNELGNV